jgi:CubicO group peptidase (beta-lactamase class C family)
MKKAFRRYCIISIFIFLSLTLALTSGFAKANPTLQGVTDFAAIDAYVAEQVNNLDIPGLVLGIVQDGEIVHLQGFGVADSSGRAVTPQTPFYIGSVTKSFTALAVMQLVEGGLIDLDAPVQTYLPWFELADKETSAKITVRHLVNQTSGISEKDGNRFWNSQQGLEETVRGLDTIHLTQPVGSIYQYCNLNYVIAGLIVEKVSGQSYADYVTEHIFERLDMRHSYTSRAPALADGLSKGHYYMFGQVFEFEGAVPPAYIPTGFLITSVEDMTHFAIAQLNDGQYGDTSVLSLQGITEMHTPAIPTGEDAYFAIGWNVATWEGVPVVLRLGDTGHFHADIMLLPESDLGVVLLANASGFEQQNLVDQISIGVLSLLNNKPAAPVSVPFSFRFLYWAILLTPLLQIIGFVLVWRKRQSIKGWGVLVTVVLNLAVVSFPLVLSQNIPFPLPSMLVFYPEVAYGLIVVTTLGIGWSVIYTVMYLRARSSK